MELAKRSDALEKINTYTESHVLNLNDVGSILLMNSASGTNVAVPHNSVTDFPIGAAIVIEPVGDGSVYVVAMPNVTLNSAASFLKLKSKYGRATLIKVSANTWHLAGDIAVSDKADLGLSFLNVPGETEIAIDMDDKTIDVLVPFGTVITALVAMFIASAYATSVKIGGVDQVSGVTENDFTNAKTYVVVAQDGVTTQNWVVTVTVDAA